MIKRTIKRGAKLGHQFWGCSATPTAKAPATHERKKRLTAEAIFKTSRGLV